MKTAWVIEVGNMSHRLLAQLTKFLETGHAVPYPFGCFAQYAAKGPYVNFGTDMKVALRDEAVEPVTLRSTYMTLG